MIFKSLVVVILITIAGLLYAQNQGMTIQQVIPGTPQHEEVVQQQQQADQFAQQIDAFTKHNNDMFQQAVNKANVQVAAGKF